MSNKEIKETFEISTNSESIEVTVTVNTIKDRDYSNDASWFEDGGEWFDR